MTSVRFLEFLLLLLHQVYSEDEAEPVFRAEGSAIEMGYCFGVDYIVVYRCAPVGDQLLGNSSADSMPVVLPTDLQGRIHISKHQQLLGLQISGLTHKDSGVYRRECWQNQLLVSQHMQRLSVCNEEFESEEITMKEEDGGAELLCNNTSIGSEGTSVCWYHETYPLYKPTLFLDSSVSLDPLVEELRGVMEVRDNGALLLLNNSMLKDNQHFVCLVRKGKTCLSFQTMHLPDRSESWDIFVSQGDRVVLKCLCDGSSQRWETPLGRINGSSMNMNISFHNKSEDFSLVIPAFSEEFIGDYSCISSSLQVQYFLVLCPKKESQDKVFLEGRSIMLDCDAGKDDSHRVLWHRQEPSGKNELIHDSDDMTVPIPEDLRGRLTENGSSLMISHLEVNDQGVYWCVVLGDAEFLEVDDDYKDDHDDEGPGEEDFGDGLYWDDTPRCIFKQETILNLQAVNRNYETGPTADQPAAPNVTAYAVGAGLVGVLVVGAVVAVIALKRRTKALPKQRAYNSELNMTKDIKMNVDPDCTKSLTHYDESGA